MDLSNKVAIVTGSARGIGQAIALKLAEVGATIVVNDISEPETMEGTVAAIKVMNRQALAVRADVSSAADVARLVETTVGTCGRVDILVNNAGVTRDQLVMRMSDEEWDAVLAIDLKSASVVGITGNAGQANYAAAKAGIIGLTKSIAREVGSRGITANAVAPGFIDTKMTQALDEKQRQELLKHVPAGFIGTPRDVAEAVAFLASEEARYITGQVLNVDGGMAGA
jgi:3-oxoacyl-[acyl-carrier protein] reductase